jgi:hypothetical protein
MRCHSLANSPPTTCREEAPVRNSSGASEFCGRRRDFLESAQSPRTKSTHKVRCDRAHQGLLRRSTIAQIPHAGTAR